MNHFRSIRTFTALALTGLLFCQNSADAKKPTEPPGGGGGGSEMVNPAWVVRDQGNLKLLSFDGRTSTTLKSAGSAQLYAPEFSPDGAWVAYVQKDGNGLSINRIRIDGTQDEELVRFTSGSSMWVEETSQLTWVPGEVDRIVYAGGYPTECFVLSTVTGEGPTPLGLWGAAPTLSPDREPETPGYQGAIAYSSGLLNVLLMEDTEAGLVIDESSRQTYWSLGRRQVLPNWSNDGLEIAMLYGDESLAGTQSATTLLVLPVAVDATGITLQEEALRIVSYEPVNDLFFRPTWSPDDVALSYSLRENGSYKLFVTDSLGAGAPTQVSKSRKSSVQYPDWNPQWDSSAP